MSYSLWPHGLQRTRPPCPSLSPGVCLSSYPLSRWCYPTSILCHPLLLLPLLFPSIRVFSSELTLHVMWPEYGNFSFSIVPNSEYSGLISFRIDWFDFHAVQGTLESLLQHHSLKHQFFGAQLFNGPTFTSVHDYWKTIALTIWTFVSKVMSLLVNTLSRFVIAFLPRKAFHFF